MIEKNSKAFFLIFILIILLSIGLTYYRSMVLKDFERSYSEEPEETEELTEEIL